MKYIEKNLIMILRQHYIEKNIKILEDIGYKRDTTMCDENISVYTDNNQQNVIAIIPGISLRKIMNDISIVKIHSIIDNINARKENINNVIKKYSDANIIFVGHSIGGFIINLVLNNTKYKCYTYNPSFVNRKSSDNIKNYRTDADILSLGLIGKEEQTINIDFMKYFTEKKGNIFDYLLDVHETTIVTKLENISIDIPVPKPNNE
jgi:hypothetical protein